MIDAIVGESDTRKLQANEWTKRTLRSVEYGGGMCSSDEQIDYMVVL